MSDGPRIQFDDDSPSPPQQRPFWIALVALFIAIGTFVIAGRDRPASDLEVVDLPTPPAPTTTTVPPTTEPQLLVEDWVPSFDRSLILVTHEDEVSIHAKRVIRLRDGLIQTDEINGDKRVLVAETRAANQAELTAN